MTEQPVPQPEPSPVEPSATPDGGFKRTLRTVGTGLGCLAFLIGVIILVLVVLAVFFDNPTLWIAVVALVVAAVAYKAAQRNR